MADLERQILPLGASLRDVLNRLNEGICGIVLITEENGSIAGIFTDGDARRAVLKAESLDLPAREFMNRSFTVVEESLPKEDRLARLNEKIRHLPVVDESGRPVEVLSWAEFWKLPLVEPSLGGNELAYVSECIRTNWISSQGNFVTRFEELFAEYHGVAEAVSVSSGTTALHLALVAMGIGDGDEVIVPNLTFGATANAVVHARAKPVFVDINPGDWTISPADIAAKITPATKAIIPVHLYGLPACMDAIGSIAEEHGILVLEDCAESLGARFEDRLTGTFGYASAFSFFANKTITTGEGGMILTEDQELAERMRLLRDHGMNKGRRYWHEEPGFNYRITNMQSAVGCAQMERLDKFLEHRQEIGSLYRERLGAIEGINLQEFGTDRKSSFWLYSVVLDESCELDRDELMHELEREGIESRPMFYPLDQQPAYRDFVRGGGNSLCPESHRIASRGLSLPTSNHMKLDEAERVCRTMEKILERGSLLRA